MRYEEYQPTDVYPSGQSDTLNLDGTLHNKPGYLPGASCSETHHAAIVAATVPSTMVAGQAYPVSVTVRNTGTRVWTSQLQYGLGAGPADTTWGTPDHVWLAPGEAIGPDQIKTFSWTLTAPATPGPYNFNWQMVQTQWFGATTNIPVTVVTSAPPLAAPVVYVLEENHALSETGLPGNSVMPYLSSLLTAHGALAANFYANTHPSIPNYHWILSGSNDGVTTNDCLVTVNQDNLFRQLIEKGISFRVYIESLSPNQGVDFVKCSAAVSNSVANWGFGNQYSHPKPIQCVAKR